jgi:hypothetical protein
MTVNPKQIKGPAATHCGAPPRSTTIIDQTLKLSKRNRKKWTARYSNRRTRIRENNRDMRGESGRILGTCVAYQERQQCSPPATGGSGGTQREERMRESERSE